MDITKFQYELLKKVELNNGLLYEIVRDMNMSFTKSHASQIMKIVDEKLVVLTATRQLMDSYTKYDRRGVTAIYQQFGFEYDDAEDLFYKVRDDKLSLSSEGVLAIEKYEQRPQSKSGVTIYGDINASGGSNVDIINHSQVTNINYQSIVSNLIKLTQELKNESLDEGIKEYIKDEIEEVIEDVQNNKPEEGKKKLGKLKKLAVTVGGSVGFIGSLVGILAEFGVI